MFYHLLLEKHQFLLAQYFPSYLRAILMQYLNSITKDPTIDNFLGKFIFGYIKKSSDNVKTIIKMVHDYQTKESNIDLIRESHITEKAIIRNKVISWIILCITLIARLQVDIILEHHSRITSMTI